jgi:hypothetical protein
MPEAYTPDPIVLFAFGYTGPFTTIPSSGWVDVSAYVAEVSTNRGRSSELDQFSAGTCTITLEADDRRFDPLNTAGPYYGDLLPNTPVRILGRLAGPTDYPIFYGYADAFRHQPTTHTSTVEVPCTDAFKVLARTRPPGIYETVVLADDPTGYWGLGEADGTAVDRTDNRNDGQYVIVPGRAQPPVVAYSAGGSMSAPKNDESVVLLPEAARTTDFPVTVEAWIQTSEPFDPNGKVIQNQYSKSIVAQGNQLADGTVTGQGWAIWVTWASMDADDIIEGFLLSTYAPAGMTSYDLDHHSAAGLDDGRPHHIVFVIDDITTRTLYVDGVELAPTSELGPFTSTNNKTLRIGGGAERHATAALPAAFPGRIDEVAIWDQVALTPAQILEHYVAGTAPWDGELTGARVTAVLDLIGWPAGLRTVSTGEVVLGPADLTVGSVLDYLQLVTATEAGRLFVSSAGEITFQGNDATITGTSAYTFIDDGTGAGILDDGIALSLDDTFLYEAAVVSRSTGQPQRALATGVTDPVATIEVTGLLAQSDGAARALADRLVFRYGTPRTRVEGWTVQPEADPGDWAAILGLELGDVVTVELTPASTGSAVSVDLFVESIAHTVNGDDWVIAFTGSPVDDTVYFEWGGPDGSGWGEGAWR